MSAGLEERVARFLAELAGTEPDTPDVLDPHTGTVDIAWKLYIPKAQIVIRMCREEHDEVRE